MGLEHIKLHLGYRNALWPVVGDPWIPLTPAFPLAGTPPRTASLRARRVVIQVGLQMDREWIYSRGHAAIVAFATEFPSRVMPLEGLAEPCAWIPSATFEKSGGASRIMAKRNNLPPVPVWPPAFPAIDVSGFMAYI